MAKLPKRVNFSRLQKVVASRTASLKARSKQVYNYIYSKVERRPLTSFGITLAILLLLIVASNFITKPKTQDAEPPKEAIEVNTFAIGQAPMLTVPAQIEKEGVISIVAQAPGIVTKVNVKDGQSVLRGQLLVNLSSNYSGGNAASVQRQLAGVQAQTARVAFDAQKDIIAKQREIAEKTDSNADELRSIADKSLGDTRSQVTLNESILSSIETNIQQLEASNVGGANDVLILQTKQLQSQFLSATAQTRSALRTAELQADENKPPAQLSNLAREVTIKQLDLQEKTTALSLEAANLQVKLAQINESSFFPTSPLTGTVERVHVRFGQNVSPGTVLATISTSGKSTTAMALVPQNIAASISKLQSSNLIIGDTKHEVTPIYVSKEAVSGQLYSVLFAIPAGSEDLLTDLSFIDVEIPVGSFTSQTVPFVPLDSVHQTQDKAIVFVVDGGKAQGKDVTLGTVHGNFIEITSGLENQDMVIVNRNIVSGDPVKPKVL